MKKFICALLTSALLLTSMVPAFAAGSIDVTEGTLGGLVGEFGEGMPETAEKRIYIWKTFKAYMLDGNNGINTIIDVLEGEKEVPENLKPVFDKYVTGKEANFETYIFMLKLYSATDLEARKVSLNNFGAEEITLPTGGKEIAKTPLPVSAEAAAAANEFFFGYIPDDREDDLTNVAGHDLDATNFLNLLTPFKGEFKMTSNEEGEIVLATYDEGFAKDLGVALEGYEKINGVEINSEWSYKQMGYKALTAIAKIFDSVADEKQANLITVLSDSEIDLYEAGLDEAEDITKEEDKEDKDDGDTGEPSRPSSGTTGRPSSRPSKDDKKDFVNEEPAYSPNDLVFNDVEKNSWAAPYVVNMTNRKIFVGYEDGSFRPDIKITRQEVAIALVRAMGLEADVSAAAGTASGFSDDASIAPWARGYVNIAVSQGIFTGYDDGEFKPTRTISRQELATVIMRLCGDTSVAQTLNYTDASTIQDYAKAFVGRATTLGIVGGYPDGTFKPFQDVTRAEAAKMLYGGLEYYKYLGK